VGESGGDGRIPELLAEGQGAAERGDYQGAIDAWSRIFLIDVDHEEAARRIEEARRLKAEREREVEEVFHEGLAALERGDRDGARERFERVLAVQPNHLAARDALRQMESGEPVRLSTASSAGDTVGLGGLGGLDLGDLTGAREGAAPGELTEEILVPPPPGSQPAQGEAEPAALPSYGKAAVGRDPGRRSFLLVGGLVLVLVAAAAVLVVLNKDRWFPNSEVDEPVAGAPGESDAPGPIERATDLHERGQTAMALGVLRRLRPDDPRHAEAQELIALWESPPAPEAEAAAKPVAPTALARRVRLLAAAGAAHEEGDHLLAGELLDRAAEVAALEGPDLELEQAVDRELARLADEITLFREGEYEMVLPRLWRLYEADPSDRDVRRMLVGSYYNRGVRQLQRGDPAGAAREFEEALEIAPGDPELERHYLFAQTYERRPRDLLYRIYVKYLPFR
jgi:tetratricopeptide (TPR) repeat protein